jgi:hypothetical protein
MLIAPKPEPIQSEPMYSVAILSRDLSHAPTFLPSLRKPHPNTQHSQAPICLTPLKEHFPN